VFLKQDVATHLCVESFLQCIAELSWDIILMKDHANFCHLNIKMMEFCLKNVSHCTGLVYARVSVIKSWSIVNFFEKTTQF
jgi:hypothetical protein